MNVDSRATTPVPEPPGDLLDRLLPPRPLDPDLRRRCRLLLFAALAVAGLCPVAIAFQLRFGLAGNALPVAVLMLSSLGLAPLLHYTGRVVLAGNLLCALVWATLAGASLNAGALTLPPFLILPVVPALAVLICGVRWGLVWLGLVGLFLVGIHLAVANGLEPVMALPERVHPVGKFWGTGIAAALTTAICMSYERTKDRALAELDQARAELLRRNDALAAQNRQLDEFALVAAHDLKEPVRGMGSLAGFVLEDVGAGLPDTSTGHLEKIQQMARDLQSRIDAMLSTSRAQRRQLDVEPVSVGEVAAEVAGALSVMLEARGVELYVEDSLGTATCDRAALGEILHNLVTNAARYNDKSRRWIRVGRLPDSARAGLPGSGPALYVQDNGNGIDEADRERVFEMFRRLRGAPPGEGTGVGLAMVRTLVERHGGGIRLDSKPGQGSTFAFSLG